jgi:hypothetical protein
MNGGCSPIFKRADDEALYGEVMAGYTPHYETVKNSDGTQTTRPVYAQNTTALATQVGGDHYKKYAIQPIEFITANNIPYIEGNIIKYVARWRDKAGLQDLKKARHYLDMLIEKADGLQSK